MVEAPIPHLREIPMIRNILSKTFAVLKILVCGVVECLGALPKLCEDLRIAAEKLEKSSITIKDQKSDQTRN